MNKMYLAVIPFCAHFSIHALLHQGGRNSKAVPHAEDLGSAVSVTYLYCAVQDNIPLVQLNTTKFLLPINNQLSGKSEYLIKSYS